jgi:hypothetical protein
MSDRRPHGPARHNIVSGDTMVSGDALRACGGSKPPHVLI